MTEFSDLNLCPINNRQGIVIDGEDSKAVSYTHLVQATVKLFTLFGWCLFVAGTAVAIFDVAIDLYKRQPPDLPNSAALYSGAMTCKRYRSFPQR